MSAIWQTVVGRDDPVDGRPNQFLAVERLFGSIEESMKELDQSFDSIRSGTSVDFRGAAADAFGDKLNSISTAVGTVPIIAGQLEQTLRNHRRELERLQREANKAVAQAQSNWNEKRSAEASRAEAHQRLGFVDRQITWLESQGDAVDEGDKAYWTSERLEAQSWVSSSDRRSDRADDAVEESRHDWRRLHQDEDELDERTAKALDGIVLWTLADPSMLEQFGAAFGEFWGGIAELGDYVFSGDLLLDLCEVIYEVLDVVSLVLSLISLAITVVGSLVLAFSWFTGIGAALGGAIIGVGLGVGKVALALDFVNVGLGAVLALNHRREWSEVGRKFALALVSVVLTKVMSKMLKAGAVKDLKNAPSLADRFKRAETINEVADGASAGEGIIGGLFGGQDSADDSFFDFSPEFRRNRERGGQYAKEVLSNFDFDPPLRGSFRSSLPLNLRLAPTGW